MKQIIYSIFGICLLLTVASCSKDEIDDSWIPEGEEGPVFRATIEADSKAVLNTASMIVEWEDDDEITIVDALGTRVLYVATKDPENSKKAVLTKKPGEENSLGSGPYTAYYPSSIVSGLPSGKVYYNDADSDIKSLPMAAQSEDTSLDFKSLCAVIKLTLPAKSGYNFKSVTLSSENRFMSGAFLISSDAAVLTSGKRYCTLNRANAKSMSSDQTYYLPIPVGTYDNLQIMVYNNAQGEQSFFLNKTRTFERNTIYPLTLDCDDFRTNLSRDLSFDSVGGDPDNRYLTRKTANCYYAPGGNRKYKFLPTKGEDGELVTGIKSVKVLWEAQAGTAAPAAGIVVHSPSYNKGYIEFDTGTSQGNALIAAYDGENGTGNILWSWHIWRANSVFLDVVYPHGETMMDRNVGTFSNAAGVNSIGLYYQYGRKDPFPGRGDESGNLAAQNGTGKSNAAGPVSIATSIKNPTVFYTTTGSSNWSNEASKSVWNGEVKTMYDPCPSGYRVPEKAVFTSDGSTVDSENFSEWTGSGIKAGFTYSTYWFPATGRILNTTGSLHTDYNSSTFVWCRDAYVLQKSGASTLRFTAPGKAYAVSMRCQKIIDSERTLTPDTPDPAVYTDEMRFVYADRTTASIHNLYTNSTEWTWEASDSDELSGYESYFDNLSEVRPVNGGADLLICATGGGVAMVHVADKSVKFFATPMGQPHGIELLPDGNVVVACSVTYDGNGNMLKVYKVPGSGMAPRVTSPWRTVFNYSGHNVVWDSTNGILWATSDNVINGYTYDELSMTLSLSLSVQLPTGNAHDLYPVYGQNSLWVTTGSAVYIFNTDTHKYQRVDTAYSDNVKSVSSGPDGFPILISYPTVDYYTDSVIDISGVEHFNKPGSKIYKVRWMI